MLSARPKLEPRPQRLPLLTERSDARLRPTGGRGRGKHISKHMTTQRRWGAVGLVLFVLSTQTQTHIHTDTQTHIHTYTHTHIHTASPLFRYSAPTDWGTEKHRTFSKSLLSVEVAVCCRTFLVPNAHGPPWRSPVCKQVRGRKPGVVWVRHWAVLRTLKTSRTL